jgi:octaprenyl-diphosphate synthase
MILTSEKFNLTSDALLKKAKPYLDALVDFINTEVNEFEPEIRELTAYCMKPQGKKIRPMLIFFSGWKDDSPLQPDLVRAAAVMEMVHQATLVHDDILDDASIRHNALTISKKYNAHVAVLLGDALFSHALHLASNFNTIEVCKIVSKATRQVCSGEISQSLKTNDVNISKEEYYRIIDLKTAELFGASCKLGATLANYDSKFIDAVTNFGRHLGIAYQLFDDLSDIIDSESNTGKTLGTDLASHKFTLPIILLLNKLNDADRLSFSKTLEASKDSSAYLIKQLHEHDIISKVMQAFDSEISLAEKSIKAWSSLQPYPYLMSISNQICTLANRLRS